MISFANDAAAVSKAARQSASEHRAERFVENEIRAYFFLGFCAGCLTILAWVAVWQVARLIF